jgi:ribose transport system substrate-binding protein
MASFGMALFGLGDAAAAGSNEVAVIVKTTSSNFWQNVNKGAAAAIQAMSGYTLTFHAVNRKVAGIVLAPSDPDALVPSVKKAWEARIPVVLIDSALNDSAKNYYKALLATDNNAAGELCAKALIDRIGKNGKIAIFSYVAGVGSEIGRVGGFRQYIEANSNLKIVATQYSQSQVAAALNQTTDVLSANPDLRGVFGANEPTAVGMGRALVQSGKAGKVVAIGFDGNADLQKLARNGTLAAIAVQGSYQMGYRGVKTIAELLSGKKPAKFANTGVVLVTKSNIDSPEAKQVLY